MNSHSLDAKTMYAQSSDIKSRTYLEYRRDMKKKAIAELEVLDWLRSKLRGLHPNEKTTVLKAGGDAFVWFLRAGGVSREADFQAEIGNKSIEIEFQYADKLGLDFYDFKLSKVGKKTGQTRVPHANKQFVYIVKPTLQYAIFDCTWIMRNGAIGEVPAWRSPAYRVPKDRLERILERDELLGEVVKQIDIKNDFLAFQHQLLDIWRDKLSYLLQSVIDEDKLVKIVPKNLDSFHKVIFMLEHLNRVPQNAGMWLVYLLSYIDDGNDSDAIAKIVYCIDFLYSKIRLEQNELDTLTQKITKLMVQIRSMEQPDGIYKSSPTLSPIDEVRNVLFSINLLEDITQDAIYYYSIDSLEPIRKIFQSISQPEKTHKIITSV